MYLSILEDTKLLFFLQNIMSHKVLDETQNL